MLRIVLKFNILLTNWHSVLFEYLSVKSSEMSIKPGQINKFLLLKLPAAYFCGVRLKTISENDCTVTVKHRWINQNPFRSLYWAVQGMSAELSTGALVMAYIRDAEKPISMLVANNKGTFLKKARGRITFNCEDGQLVKETIQKAIETGEGQTQWMHSRGVDQNGDVVSEFSFEWTIKVKER